MQIGDLAARAGVTPRTIRYYEELGIVEPEERTEGGFRLYSEAQLRCLQIVQSLKDLGFELERIREFFNLKMSGSGNRVIIAQQKPLPDQGQLKVNAQPLYEPLKPYGVEILEFPARMGTRPDWDQTRRVLTDQFSPANLLGR